MTHVKDSKIDISDKKSSKNKMGSEFGAVILNKEENYPAIGDWKIEIPIVDGGKCIGCSTCARNCPEGTIVMKENGGKRRPVVQYKYCKGCGVCAHVCPVEAISMKITNKKS